MSKYKTFDVAALVNRTQPEETAYQKIVNMEPPAWALRDVEVLDEDNKVKTVKAMKLAATYSLLDSIYSRYDITTPEIRLIGKAMIVTVRLLTEDHDGVIRVREGSGFIEAKEGVRNATVLAEANAIKNAAKKLGRIFGRDLYADDEAVKITPPPPSDETHKGEQTIQRVNDVNPVYKGIFNQIQKVTDPAELVAIGQNVIAKTDSEDLDATEFDHLTDLINQKAQSFKINKKKNENRKTNTSNQKGASASSSNAKAPVKPGARKSQTPTAPARRPANTAAKQGGKGSRGVRGNG